LVTSQLARTWLGAVLSIASMVGLAISPYLLSRAIDDGLRPEDMPRLLLWTAALLGVGVLNALVGIWRHRTMTKIRMDGAFRTVHAVVEQTTRLGGSLTGRVSTGEIATIGIGDVGVVSTSLTVVGPGIGALVAYLVIAAVLLSISPVLATIVLLGVPALVVLVGPLLGRLQQRGTSFRQQQGALTTRLIDIVEGLSVLNSVGGKDLHAREYQQRSGELRDSGIRVGAVASWLSGLAVGLPALFLAGVTWAAARMAAEGTISIGELVAVYGYVAVLVTPVAELIDSGVNVSQAHVSARRIVAMLRLRRDNVADDVVRVPGPAGSADLHDPTSGITLQRRCLTAVATARAPDAAAAVERLAGFAPSDVTWGHVRLRDVDTVEVRRRILLADHEAYIFAGPLRDVVAGRCDRDDRTLTAALHTAAAEDVVAGLPDGLSSAVASQGRNMSGGQRQRMRLARAVADDPEVLLAIDPTSAVDAHTESLVASRLRAAREGRTTLLATTSPVLLDQADIVHHLVDGTVVATGTHRELLAHHPGYRRLVSRGLEDDEDAGTEARDEVTATPLDEEQARASKRMT
jgi:ABC-type multidrug transport system fused ATPase/permease subunit